MKPRKVAHVLLAAVLLLGILSAGAAAAELAAPNEPWTKERVDMFPDAQVGTHVSIAHYPGSGAIYASYYDAQNDDLRLAHQVTPGTGNCFTNDSWVCETIDSTGNVGQYSSIDIVRVPADLPIPPYIKIGISYYDATNGALKFAQYSSLTGGWSIQVIDDTDTVGSSRGSYSSFKYGYNRKPFIAYHTVAMFTSGSVRSASYLGDGSGNCGPSNHWFCETIDSMSDQISYGTHVTVDVDYEGSIEVAFYDSFNSQLVWAHYWGFGGSCSNPAWNCVVVDGAGDVGKYASISAKTSPTDKLRLVYLDETVSHKVKYAVSVGSGGNCTSAAFDCFDVDDIGYPPDHVGLSIDVDLQGQPVIAYMSAFNDTLPLRLKVAHPAAAMGLDWGNCGEPYPEAMFNYWQCQVIDPGAAFSDEAEYAALDIGPGGLAAVAYVENNTQSDEKYLKVAYQFYTVHLPIIRK